MRNEPATDDVRAFLDAARAFRYGVRAFGFCCPYCEGKGDDHLSTCQVVLFKKELLLFEGWSENTAENHPDIRNLVLVVREIVFALDGFDPEFCALSQPLVEILKAKLAPFEEIM